MKLKPCVMAMLLLSAFSISADPRQTPDINAPRGFLEMCKKTDNTENTNVQAATNEGYCFGWTYGFVEGMLTDPHKPTMCLPQNGDTLSAVFVIKKYIQNHPEQQNLETPVLARAALMSEYPCK
jgi:hypothetical protein